MLSCPFAQRSTKHSPTFSRAFGQGLRPRLNSSSLTFAVRVTLMSSSGDTSASDPGSETETAQESSRPYVSSRRQPYSPRRLQRIASVDSEQSLQDVLRAGPSQLSRQTSDQSANGGVASTNADRKRRLTESGSEGDRWRDNSRPDFQERHQRRYESRMEAFPDRLGHRNANTIRSPTSRPEVIDLTGSSPDPPLPALPQPPQPIHRQSTSTRSLDGPSRVHSHSSRKYSVPPWQSDSDVGECPVCGRTFGFLFRRHHCRKCGRVVCGECSPHRITLPRSMIVYPPGTELLSSPPRTYTDRHNVSTIDLTGDDDEEASGARSPSTHSHHSDLEGGLKVRLCNPCVPDPQPNPQADDETPDLYSNNPVESSRLIGRELHQHNNHFPRAPVERARAPYPPQNISAQNLGRNGPQRYSFTGMPGTATTFGSLPQASGSPASSSYDDPFSRLRRMMGVCMTY